MDLVEFQIAGAEGKGLVVSILISASNLDLILEMSEHTIRRVKVSFLHIKNSLVEDVDLHASCLTDLFSLVCFGEGTFLSKMDLDLLNSDLREVEDGVVEVWVIARLHPLEVGVVRVFARKESLLLHELLFGGVGIVLTEQGSELAKGRNSDDGKSKQREYTTVSCLVDLTLLGGSAEQIYLPEN